MKLHLGVIDVPHIQPGVTTYDVGMELEKDYGLFSAFYELFENSIDKAVEKDVQIAIDKLLSGKDPKLNFGTSTSAIDTMFHQFLDSGAIESMGKPGVPTKAALEGKRTRFKGKGSSAKTWVKGKRSPVQSESTGVRRPSFVDSGILNASFKSWID